ncbi:MAG: co-chaperone GroES [Clostridia bacterium]|nr:co-chaperone GroES [Clostridia bacterium]
MNLKPLFDRVVLKPIKNEVVKQHGLILPETNGEKPNEGIVVSVGQGESQEGKETKMQVKIGDRVLYSKYGGINFKNEGNDYVILRQNDILGVFEK